MSVTPDFIGQRYKDTNTGNIWIANSTTPGDWTLEVQNTELMWTPRTLLLGRQIGYISVTGIAGVTSIAFAGTSLGTFDIEFCNDLVSIDCPNITGITASNYIYIAGCNALTSISFPLLQTGRSIQIQGCPLLTSISFPSLTSVNDFTFAADSDIGLLTLSAPNLVSVGGNITAEDSTSLATVNLSSLLPTNGKTLKFINCALTAASVNHILSRCVANAGYVSGGVNLSGGTSAAPTGQGIIDKATLNGRLAGLAVTN